MSIISPKRGYTALDLPLRLIERDFCSVRHAATYVLCMSTANICFISLNQEFKFMGSNL